MRKIRSFTLVSLYIICVLLDVSSTLGASVTPAAAAVGLQGDVTAAVRVAGTVGDGEYQNLHVPLEVQGNASASAATPLQSRAASRLVCSTEQQIVHCSHIISPEKRQICCQLHFPAPETNSNLRIGADPAALAQSEAVALARTTRRTDLHSLARPGFQHLHPRCLVPVRLPVFPLNSNSHVEVMTQFVPRISSQDIRRIKSRAMEHLPVHTRVKIQKLQWVDEVSGFVHPAALAGPTELVLMQERLHSKQQPQYAAQRALVTGGGVRPKFYTNLQTGRKWAPPTDCPPEGYRGPFAVPDVDIDWGGLDAKPPKKKMCAETFDPNAPQHMCGHLSFVELDATMAYKQAMAWWTTGDKRYAEAALDIIAAWAGNRTHWGVKTRNGPLEAGWGVAGGLCREC